MWSLPVYASHSEKVCTRPVATRTMPTNAMSKSGTPRMSVGVSSAMTGSFAAHSPITARPASVKPMNVAPPSPRKIFARPRRKLYGRNPRHAPTRGGAREPVRRQVEHDAVRDRHGGRADLSEQLEPRRQVRDIVEDAEGDHDRRADGHALEVAREIEVQQHGRREAAVHGPAPGP